MTAKYDQDWPLEQNTDPHHHPHHQSICDQPSCFIKHRPGLWVKITHVTDTNDEVACLLLVCGDTYCPLLVKLMNLLGCNDLIKLQQVNVTHLCS